MLNITESILRDIFMTKTGLTSLVWNLDFMLQIQSAAEKNGAKPLLIATECVSKYRQMLDRNVNYAVLSASFANELWEVLG